MFLFHEQQVRLLEKAGHSMAQFDDEQLVVVSQVMNLDFV